MFSKVQILIIWNSHESHIRMNGNVKFVETSDINSEHMCVKWKYVVIVVWNILWEFKFHFYHFLAGSK